MNLSLQMIIGTDKNNPYYTIYRDESKKQLYVYHGHACQEVISENAEEPALKYLVTRLWIAKVKVKSLHEHFGYTPKTIRKWGKMLQAGELSNLFRIWEGGNSNLKITTEIKNFVVHQFASIYPSDKYTYSKNIRKSIQEVFKVNVSPETLRPLFKELKESYKEEHLKKKES